ncbi:MAG TPA: glutamine synthetase III [Anaerohalosphaeraceae bacterium]|nr:glutamine synthetase III [Anaerohalosphaeraceae bacterium]
METSGCKMLEIFGTNVFNDALMRERLPKDIYIRFQEIRRGDAELTLAIADVIANAMKDWALEKGATHYCHWFQPMTGLTAEKHDSFISATLEGKPMIEFGGKELMKGEPDASSFPSGGLRATFEARGYTAWDYSSSVFVKNKTLYIPCAFCSYNGQALDKKTPLLRSMDALNRQAVRVLKTLGKTDVNRVIATLGPEQEYFLIDRRFFEKRLDLMLTGRTLLGAPSPRGQEMEDHYFGTLRDRIASFMEEVNTELWKLGVSAKTQHHETAPAQYELAPVFTTANVATDHNQLIMEALQKTALRHGFVCLLHEKPFIGVNGSGKHNNWSIMTDTGINLLDPGQTPHDNMIFLVFLCAVVRAVDKYAKLLRASVANPGNEHRLGAHEAPPAIVSVFLGEHLTEVFEQLATGGARKSWQNGHLRLGTSLLPPLPRDCTDRNRTSPFAFTGNKFEFRMVGSSQSCAGPAFVINTIVADVLREIADILEASADVNASVQKLLQKIASEHARIIFNGDNYSPDWVQEAARRGLPNIPSAVESIATILEPENIAVFERNQVLSRDEQEARVEIFLENYIQTIHIEAATTLHIVKRQILPVCQNYAGKLAAAAASLGAVGVKAASFGKQMEIVCKLIDELREAISELEGKVCDISKAPSTYEEAKKSREEVLPAMASVRKAADALEMLVDAEVWPLPTYAEMLFL